VGIAILFILLFGMIALGIPVAIALAGSSALFVIFFGTVPEMVVAHRMVNGVDSFPLLAVPFFILAGNLMNTAGITERIFEFAKALIGWMRGGLGHVNVGASVIFAGMSGAAVADAGDRFRIHHLLHQSAALLALKLGDLLFDSRDASVFQL
jgi:TRAP-type mannitol/chloroaromatic compound transport system permease large subunit